MKKLIGYETKECGRKVMILEEIDERTEKDIENARKQREKVAEKFGLKY